jgi:hypothetical protein
MKEKGRRMRTRACLHMPGKGGGGGGEEEEEEMRKKETGLVQEVCRVRTPLQRFGMQFKTYNYDVCYLHHHLKRFGHADPQQRCY